MTRRPVKFEIYRNREMVAAGTTECSWPGHVSDPGNVANYILARHGIERPENGWTCRKLPGIERWTYQDKKGVVLGFEPGRPLTA